MDISVIIPSYNNVAYIRDTIDSLLDQTLLPSTILVADDNSTDETPTIIEEYADEYPNLIRPLFYDENVGIAGNYNRALEEVDSDLVTWLPGDDRYRSKKIESEVEKYQAEPDAEVVFSNFCYTTPDGKAYREWADSSSPPTGNVLLETLTREWPDTNLFRCPTVSYDALETIGFFDEDMKVFLDWDLKISLACNFEVAYCPAVLQEYRVHPGGHSRTVDAIEYVEDTRRIRQKHQQAIKSLSPTEQQRVEETFDQKELLFESRRELEAGNRFTAQRKYATYLTRNPSDLLRYQAHARYLLPNIIHRPVRKLYRRIVY